MAVPCGFEHKVAKGDSLSSLSGMDMHYAVQDYWPILYSYNRDRLGNNPDLIHPGIMLRIPCLDESGQPLPGQFVDSGGENSVATHNHDHGAQQTAEKDDSAAVDTATSEEEKSPSEETASVVESDEPTTEPTVSSEPESTHDHSAEKKEQPAQQAVTEDNTKPAETESVELKPAESTATNAADTNSTETAKTASAISEEQDKEQKPAEPEEPQEPVQTAAATTEMVQPVTSQDTTTEQAESAPDAAPAEPISESEQQAVTVAKAEPTTNAGSVGAIDSMRLLTADEFGLFNDKNTINAGLAMQIIEAALLDNGDVGTFKISKVNDWSAHIDPLLTSHAFDLGFPWVKPDCSGGSDICDNFLFSKPIMEVANIIIVNRSSTLSSITADNVNGLTLCRPSSFDKDDIDADGRNWLSDSVISLKQPFNISECFDQLIADEVDAISVNEYHARSTINSLDIADKVKILDSSPFPGVELFALVHRNHPSADQMIGTLNASIDAIRDSGAYESIVDKK